MKATLRFLAWLVFFSCANVISAQPGTTPPEDIRPILRKMTTSQKMEMLDYLRDAGTDLNREIQQTYEQLPSAKRARAVQYLDLVNHGLDSMSRTTVAWDRDTISYGKVEDGTIILDSFRVVNTGIYPYLIKDVKTSCDCTVLQFPKYPVMPGESATIRIEFDSQGKLGPTTPGIVVYDNSSPNARNIFYLNGTVIPRVKKKTIIDN